VEPFVGGANSFHLVDGDKWGNDSNRYVVAMLQAVADGWVPPADVDLELYRRARRGEVPDHLRGFIGVGCSYGGKFFGGYARGKRKDGTPQNYARYASRSLMRQADGLSGARLTCSAYWEMDIPDGSYVYCDPPYARTTGYGGRFDSAKFWEWADELSERCMVFVSEFEAPAGWDCVWGAKATCQMNENFAKGSNAVVERLFARAV